MGAWHFIRHGQSVANAERWLAGHVDAPLTDRGRQQALAGAGPLQGHPIARVLTSDLSRATETAQLLVGDRGWPIRVERALRERHLGDWERVSRDALDRGADELMRWDLGPPGGEAPWQVALRYCSFFADLEDIEGDTLVVAHGLALKSVVGLVDDIPPSAIPQRPFGNVQHETRHIDQDRWATLRDALRRAHQA